MCGRFTQQHSTQDIADRFAVQHTLFEAEQRYNIAPTQGIAVIVTDAKRHERYLDSFQWGLIPAWAKDSSIGSKMINARAETVMEKPSFREILRTGRCLIPADGFYEWEKINGTRQPFIFRRHDAGLFGFAGLWSEWNVPGGEALRTCTIITTTANELVGRIHDRMPVILPTVEKEALWLDDSIRDPAPLLPLLKPFPAEAMKTFMVSRRLNSVANEGKELLEKATD